MKVGLWRIAHARSGDKADRADIGLFAWDVATYAVLKKEVTAARLAEHFRAICKGPVEVWPLDNILAIKIVLNSATSSFCPPRAAWTLRKMRTITRLTLLNSPLTPCWVCSRSLHVKFFSTLDSTRPW